MVISKLQDVTNTNTNTTFSDEYGITRMNSSATPTEYIREYNFTGNVKGYVTLATQAKDAADNKITDYFRVYNLDNTNPTISNVEYDGDSMNIIKATLSDAHSGIKYFGIVPKGSGDISYPTTYPNGNETSLMASNTNTWYQVSLISANGEIPESGQESVEVSFTLPSLGEFYIITEDYVGNRGYYTFESTRFDNTPPIGTIVLKNPLIAIDGSKGVNTNTALLEINAEDDSVVEYMAFANEDARNTISWVPYATEYTWTLSAGDGRERQDIGALPCERHHPRCV